MPRTALLMIKRRVPGEIWILVIMTTVISLLQIWIQRTIMTMLVGFGLVVLHPLPLT